MSGRNRLSLRVDAHQGGEILRVYVAEQPALAFPSIHFYSGAQVQSVLPLRILAASGLVVTMGARWGFLESEIKGRVDPSGCGLCLFEGRVSSTHDAPWTGRIAIRARVEDTGSPRWMIPGCFYKENRPASYAAKFPRYERCPRGEDAFASDHWSFSSDRATLPAVFCWTDLLTTALITEERFSHGGTGLHFRGDDGGTWIGIDLPYCEEPLSYCSFRGYEPVYRSMTLGPRESARFVFQVYAGPRDLHAYDAPVRERYQAMRASNPVKPWTGLEEAGALAAHGLLRWHYVEEHAVLLDTVGFDPITCGVSGGMDRRPYMSVAWAGGVPYASALLRYGRRVGDDAMVRAGTRVIEKTTEGISPAGVLHSAWSLEHGWGGGSPSVNGRIAAEATLFFLRAAAAEQQLGSARPSWEQTARCNLDFAVSRQSADGNLGYAYDTTSGDVIEWDGCGGLAWIAALCEAYATWRTPAYHECAVRAGRYYARRVRDQYLYGAPSDVYLTPTSEDGYNAVMAYVHLYEMDRDGEWLELARLAADWMLTFRFAYNVRFPDHTLLGEYDFRTQGGDVASPCNAHIHNYGLICLPEMLRLAEYAGDAYYVRRTADNLACFLQFVAREDGDFNAGRGMVTEQWYHTDWWMPKGSMLSLSHSWCVGMVLLAALHVLESGASLPEVPR